MKRRGTRLTTIIHVARNSGKNYNGGLFENEQKLELEN